MRLAAPILFAAIVPSTVAAEEMMPRSEMLTRAAEETYSYVGCAGFYLAKVEWAGQAIGQQAYAQSADAIRALGLLAALTRAEGSSSELEHSAETVNADIREIANLYLDNYRRS